ncbi:MAG: DUF692 domain-containing protein [Spirochaetia bacterium]|nr:DUF692 domain-containing protein [Spirochaetia bacterium]
MLAAHVNPSSKTTPVIGVGVGLRAQHYPYLLERPKTTVDWFEAISENYMDTEGRPLAILEFIRRDYPVALHGVSLSIGAEHPDDLYLRRWKTLVDRIDPFIVSDHLCWTHIGPPQLHDLLPLPFTDEALTRVVQNIERAQEALGRQLILENVSSYLTYRHSTMTEWEFLARVADQSGCGILLDVNNVYVSAKNHGFDAEVFIRSIPVTHVKQMHLAGFTDRGAFLFDTHSRPVHEDVWDLFGTASSLFPDVPVLIEWDDDIPPFPRLEEEARRAREIRARSTAKLN